MVGLVPVKDVDDGLESVLEVKGAVVGGDQFVGDDDQFRVVLNESAVDRWMVLRERVLNFLQSVDQAVLEEVTDLVLGLVEDFL